MVRPSSDINTFKFIGDDQAIVVSEADQRFLSDGLSPALQNRLQPVIVDVQETCANRTNLLLPAYNNLRSAGLSRITDPYHMWQALALNLRPLLVRTPLPQDLVDRMGQQVLLVIEDNLGYHAMYVPFFALERISFFGPKGIEDTKSNGDRIFTECEAALKLLTEALASNSPVPSVLIIDIELGPERMNGLQFLAQAHDLYTTYRLRNKVILACATSSHLTQYQDQIKKLIQAGIIDCGYQKTGLRAEDLAQIIGTHVHRNSKEMSTQ